MSVEIKVLRRGDESVLANVAPGVFDNPVDPALAREFLGDARHHIAVAIEEGVVIGMASGVHYIHPDKPPEMWINEVGVSPAHRGRGLGKSVLNVLLDVARAHHCKIAWVLTHRDNPSAMKLYSSAGGTEGTDGLGNQIVGYAFRLGEAAGGEGKSA